MSALRRKADMSSATRYIRFVPIADIQALQEAPNSEEHSNAGQNNSDFENSAQLCIDLNRPAMLLDDDRDD